MVKYITMEDRLRVAVSLVNKIISRFLSDDGHVVIIITMIIFRISSRNGLETMVAPIVANMVDGLPQKDPELIKKFVHDFVGFFNAASEKPEEKSAVSDCLVSENSTDNLKCIQSIYGDQHEDVTDILSREITVGLSVALTRMKWKREEMTHEIERLSEKLKSCLQLCKENPAFALIFASGIHCD
ncbi:hypothetical protein FEM48_Zijuj07G0042500 [Ziziphus jujuba var. spinosa]|uniref:Uncharacterized protein n=1 Tax=Ziziphus jujuba var. spinosa TaxID=714518 RepID=A0A978V2D9_ZIZJJ|nr:hypothetical protein FEM48_Zijuj07G0042500 [Ziziphus jujuba var. spinosa]